MWETLKLNNMKCIQVGNYKVQFIDCSWYIQTIFTSKTTTNFNQTHLSCIALEALSWSRRTSKWTWRAYFVKYNASSVAVSPPPMTARTWPLKRGDAPSQIAQALIPRLQNSSSRGSLRRFAVAPVAKMTVWLLTWITIQSRKSDVITITFLPNKHY